MNQQNITAGPSTRTSSSSLSVRLLLQHQHPLHQHQLLFSHSHLFFVLFQNSFSSSLIFLDAEQLHIRPEDESSEEHTFKKRSSGLNQILWYFSSGVSALQYLRVYGDQGKSVLLWWPKTIMEFLFLWAAGSTGPRSGLWEEDKNVMIGNPHWWRTSESDQFAGSARVLQFEKTSIVHYSHSRRRSCSSAVLPSQQGGRCCCFLTNAGSQPVFSAGVRLKQRQILLLPQARRWKTSVTWAQAKARSGL